MYDGMIAIPRSSKKVAAAFCPYTLVYRRTGRHLSPQSALDGVSDQPLFQGFDVGLHARQVRVERGGTLKGRQGGFIIA